MIFSIKGSDLAKLTELFFREGKMFLVLFLKLILALEGIGDMKKRT